MDLLSISLSLTILAAVTVCLVKEWGSPDLVAMAGFAAAILLGLVDDKDVLRVFSNPAPITIGALFILSAALYRTGTIDRLARLFEFLAGKEEKRALAALALLVIPLSACANNTAVVIVFLPVVLAFVRKARMKPAKFLLPLSYFAILGGTMTLVGTSTNLIVSGMAAEQGVRPFGIFEITPLGLVGAAVGVGYMLVAGRKLLPERETLSSLLGAEDTREFCGRAVIPEGSLLIGKPLTVSELWKRRAVRIYEVIRQGTRLRLPITEIVCQAGDVWICSAPPRGIASISGSGEVAFVSGGEANPPFRRTIRLMEAVIGPASEFIGHRLLDLHLRQRFGVLVAAVHRKGANLLKDFERERLQFGDTVIIEGPEENLDRLAEQEGLIPLNQPMERPFRPRRAPVAILAMAAVLTISAIGWLPIQSAAIAGASLVVLAGCVDPRELYHSIEWPILFLIFGMLGLGQAMDHSGAAQWIAQGVSFALEPFGALAVLAAIYLMASVLTELVTNNAVAILLTPIAIEIAAGLGVDARPFLVAVMYGASASFATPIGYQTNTYVFGAGGYKFADFLRVGIPLNLLIGAIVVIVIPVIWPFKP